MAKQILTNGDSLGSLKTKANSNFDELYDKYDENGVLKKTASGEIHFDDTQFQATNPASPSTIGDESNPVKINEAIIVEHLKTLPGWINNSSKALFSDFVWREVQGGGEPSWSPTEIEGLQVWLDASDIGLANNALVTQWNDKSGGSHHATQSTEALQPFYNNGAVVFEGAQKLVIPDFESIKTTGATVIVVSKLTSLNTADPGKYGLIFHKATSNSTTPPAASHAFGYWHTDGQDSYIAIFAHGNAAGNAIYTFPNPLERKIIISKQTNLGDMKTYVNGSLANTAPNTTGSVTHNTNDICIGGNLFDNNRSFNGELLELIVYNREINDTEMGQIVDYLTAKRP